MYGMDYTRKTHTGKRQKKTVASIRDERELLEIKQAVEAIRQAQERIRENYRALEEVGTMLCRLMDSPTPGDKPPGDQDKS
jgi:peptidyl-tRNA hydrolase